MTHSYIRTRSVVLADWMADDVLSRPDVSPSSGTIQFKQFKLQLLFHIKEKMRKEHVYYFNREVAVFHGNLELRKEVFGLHAYINYAVSKSLNDVPSTHMSQFLINEKRLAIACLKSDEYEIKLCELLRGININKHAVCRDFVDTDTRDDINQVMHIAYKLSQDLLALNEINDTITETNRHISLYTRRSKLFNRTLVFKPWKLYTSRPTYSCMRKHVYDEDYASKFDADFIIPEDIAQIITEYVGRVFIHKSHKVSVKEKYTSDDGMGLAAMLNTWNVKHLKLFLTKKLYLQFNMTDDTMRKGGLCRRVGPWPFSTSCKADYIAAILKGDHKTTFYRFQRDVIIITRILADNKVKRRNKKRKALCKTVL